MDTKNPMKYETVPTISGVKRSSLLEISRSFPVFLAQYNMIAIGSIEANIREIISRTGNCQRLSMDNVRHIIMNNGMQIIGGFVKVEIVLANLNFEFILYNIIFYTFKYFQNNY